MSIAKEKLGEISGSGEDSGSNPLGQICKNIISAFTRLKQPNKEVTDYPFSYQSRNFGKKNKEQGN